VFNIACLTFIIAWCGCEDEPPYSHHCVSVAVRMSCLTVIIACLSFIIAWCGCEDELCSTLRVLLSSLRGVAVRMSRLTVIIACLWL